MHILMSADGAEFGSAEIRNGTFERVRVAPPGNAKLVTLSFAVPIVDIQSFWIPSLRMPSMKIRWVIESRNAAQTGFPFLMFLNMAGISRCAFGLTDTADDSAFTARMNQETCCYDVTVETAFSGPAAPYDFTLDTRAVPRQDSIDAWRSTLGLPKYEFPKEAWNPVYCTWYAVHAAVDEPWVEKTGEAAAKLGFGTFIVDDGWCFDVKKRVSPETIGTWYENVGDWTVSAAKFPEFPAHVKRMQKLGLRYMVWVAPFLIGTKSKAARTVKQTGICQEGYRLLDIADEKSARIIFDSIARLTGECGLDGLKIDFLDQIPADTAAPRGPAVLKFIRDLSASVRNVRKNALIEYRQSYASPQMLEFATQFRAGDVPFDYVDNFQELCQIRMSVGDRVPVHADPAYWAKDELPVNISRHMIAELAGVPMLSMELSGFSAVEKAIVKHWLGFYREHLDTFSAGKWEIRCGRGSVAWAAVETEKERIVILADEARLEQLPTDSRTLHLLNLSPVPLTKPGGKAFGPEGEPCAEKNLIPAGGRGVFRG